MTTWADVGMAAVLVIPLMGILAFLVWLDR